MTSMNSRPTLSRQQLTIAGLMLVLALFTARTFQSWGIVSVLTIATVCLSALRLRERREQPSRERKTGQSTAALRSTEEFRDLGRSGWWQWFLGLAITFLVCFVRAGQYVGHESFNPLLLMMDMIAHGSLTAILSLWILQHCHGQLLMLCLGLFIMLSCVASGGASQSLEGQTTIALITAIGFAFASEAVLDERTKRQNRKRSENRPRSEVSDGYATDAFSSGIQSGHATRKSRLGALLSIFVLSTILIVSSTVAELTDRALPNVQTAVQRTLKDTIDVAAGSATTAGTRYVNGATIGSVRESISRQPDEIALRIYAESAPGYLRGTVFDFFIQNNWYQASSRTVRPNSYSTSMEDRFIVASGNATTALQNNIGRRLRRFEIYPSGNLSIKTMEIKNDPLKGTKIFLPANTRWIEARAREISVNYHGLIMHGIDVRAPYVAGVAPERAEVNLDIRQKRVHLFIDNSSKNSVETTAEQICGEAKGPREIADRIINYFATNYSYSLQRSERPRGSNPIEFFLTKQTSGHCELFASATVLLLRARGVPSRYVTGYVSDEFEDDESYWVARNRDAHAWAEAYDTETKRWFAVESTPGRRYRSLSFDDSALENGEPGSADSVELEDVQSPIWSSIRSFFAFFIASDPLARTFRLGQVPLFFFLVFLLWRRIRESRMEPEEAMDRQSRKMLSKMDRRMRRLSLVRRRNETLHQFADRIEARYSGESDATIGWAQKIADAYRAFATARYQGLQPPELEAMP